jgi:uncharacterized protein YdhG (YjbR/CyaY superfamily)
MSATQKSTRSTTPSKKKRYEGFTAEEKSAMADRVHELKVGASAADIESEVLAKLAEMTPADRAMGERIHSIVTTAAPSLVPRLWYGMPAYYKDGKLICHFQPAQKFKTRYATLGFSDHAKLDDGNVWPNAYALMKLTPADEAKVRALVKQAVG